MLSKVQTSLLPCQQALLLWRLQESLLFLLSFWRHEALLVLHYSNLFFTRPLLFLFYVHSPSSYRRHGSVCAHLCNRTWRPKFPLNVFLSCSSDVSDTQLEEFQEERQVFFSPTL